MLTRGVVTRIDPGRGVFLEDHEAEAGGASRGLFVRDGELSRTARPGQQLAVTGRIEETGRARDTLTALIEISTVAVCAENLELPLTRTSLPLASAEREGLEGMRVAFDAGLVLADGYNLHRGEWTVAVGEPLRLATEDADPGREAMRVERQNRRRTLTVAWAEGQPSAWPVGTTLGELVGVMAHDGARQRLDLESAPAAEPPAPDPARPATGDLRVVSLNLLNFWNGDGRGGGFPTERGARTADEYEAQKRRTAAALARLSPQLLGVQELENDGFGPGSAAQDLLDLLNANGPSDWAFVSPDPGPIGDDVITVGLFYREGVLEPVEPPRVFGGPPFEGLSRQPLAQLFRHLPTGRQLWAVVNHLKSKGRCPENGPNADQDDGQGCWNAARLDAVRAQVAWLDSLAQSSGTGHIIVMGDMNAWRREDPIRAFEEAGFRELVEMKSGLPQHSFLYFGQRGTLDYAFASPALALAARQAFIWHINADWPRDMVQVHPWLRMSDHDPVVVDFDLSQSTTSD